MSKCHIVGNHMSPLISNFMLKFFVHLDLYNTRFSYIFRLQTPLTPQVYQQPPYATASLSLPNLPPSSQATHIAPHSAPPGSHAQHVTANDHTFITQSGQQPLVPSAPLLSPIITQDQEPPVSSEPLFIRSVPISTAFDPVVHDYRAATRYTYETTPSLNRLQIEPSSYQMTSPRVVGPISRAKSAPGKYLL